MLVFIMSVSIGPFNFLIKFDEYIITARNKLEPLQPDQYQLAGNEIFVR